MSKSSDEVVIEGWLTKSPPTKRIWRARWRRRWFSLRHSGELPGQFFLTYYTDRNCRKMKGAINLDRCEQVDLGLKLEEKKLKFDHVFDIKTPTRTYYLAADTENEMKSWVTCISRVCDLKCTSGEEDLRIQPVGDNSDIEIVEEHEEKPPIEDGSDSPSLSPVSTGPYIPISECFTGRSPILESQDFQALLDHNIRSSYFRTSGCYGQQNHANDTYEFPHRTYLNCNQEFGGIFYDSPRKLTPQNSASVTANAKGKDDDDNVENKDEKGSPLQSPTDSESVFTDDDWTHNTSGDLNISRNTRPSDSSTDVDVTVTQKFTKISLENPETTTTTTTTLAAPPPPRPPKPPQRITGHNYFNLMPAPAVRNNKTISVNAADVASSNSKIITDDMYDFPRSHQVETESTRNTLGRRHCYNNAEPTNVEGHVFRYDDSPKPGTSSAIFNYDTDNVQQQQDEPVSPALSQSSAYVLYSNLNSPVPVLTMSPPAVNRDLKPKRKLSDSHSISSNPEPSSPRSLAAAPTIDRKLKPPTSIQRPEDDVVRRQRAAPSPTPPGQGRSLECLMDPGDQEQIYHYLPGSKKIQYLDLDLDLGGSLCPPPSDKTRSSEANTVYKEVDFTKTMAFNLTRNNLEKERNKEPIGYFKK